MYIYIYIYTCGKASGAHNPIPASESLYSFIHFFCFNFFLTVCARGQVGGPIQYIVHST